MPLGLSDHNRTNWDEHFHEKNWWLWLASDSKGVWLWLDKYNSGTSLACTNASVSSLSPDQFNQSGSPNGKVTPAVLLPAMAKWTLSFSIFDMPNGFVYFASWSKIHVFTWADQDWIGLTIFKNFADLDWFGFDFFGSGLDSHWKISHSAHLWCAWTGFQIFRICSPAASNRIRSNYSLEKLVGKHTSSLIIR